MTGSTQATAEVKAAAQEQLAQGNPDFTVLAAIEEESSTQYIITLPMAGHRRGIFGSSQFGTRDGYTKFGRDMLLTLNATPHILEANVGYSAPHTMTVYVSKLTEDAPHTSHQLKELSAPVAVAIQVIIIRNRGIIQRIAEYLRRLF